MNQALKIVLGIEIILGVIWTILAAMAHGPGGLGAVAVGLVIYAIFTAFFVFAAWAFWKFPAERKRAGWIMFLPLVFGLAPVVIRSMAGDFLTSQQLVGLLVFAAILAVGACWLIPARAASVVPDFLVRSKFFNWLVILAMLAGWLFLIVVAIYVATEDVPSRSGSGTGLATALIIAALYLAGLAIGNFLAATWAWLSLRGGIEGNPRKLNIAQLVIAAPAILIGVAVTVWFAGQAH